MAKNELISSSKVAETVGISKGNVNMWGKKYLNNLSKNRNGHFLYSQKDIEQLSTVKKLIDKGVTHKDIEERFKNNVPTISKVIEKDFESKEKEKITENKINS